VITESDFGLEGKMSLATPSLNAYRPNASRLKSIQALAASNPVYLLWYLTIVLAFVATILLAVNLAIVLSGEFARMHSGGLGLAPDDRLRLIQANAVLVVLAVGAHLMRKYMESSRRKWHAIPLPGVVVARTNTGDEILDNFECRARVTIHVYDRRLEEQILPHASEIQVSFAHNLSVLLADPVARYSIARMERALRLALSSLVDPRMINRVELKGMRHFRIKASGGS
jgi:hypothetical protein